MQMLHILSPGLAALLQVILIDIVLAGDNAVVIGVAASRIAASGYGDTHPVAPNDTDANRAKNRRIEFHVTR